MADQPRGGGRLPEGSRTLPIGSKVSERSPRITPPRGSPLLPSLSSPQSPQSSPLSSGVSASLEGRTTSPFPAQTPKTDPGQEEQTRTMGPSDLSGSPKFVDPADPRLRTQVSAPRTVKETPALSHRDPRDRILPERSKPEPRPDLRNDPRNDPRNEPARSTLATATLDAVSSSAAVAVHSTVETTKIWVATHKPSVDPDQRLILLRDPDSPRAASFRVLRHRLEQRGNPRVIGVTSAQEGEGKSTCAANLAMALGECGRARVLLVEANLRTPSLAALFGFLPPTCFSLQMQQHKEKPLDPWSVVEAFSPSLHVIAVKPGQESQPLLDGPAFTHAIEMLKNAAYDYLVLDTPPVLGSADVNLVEDSCDGMLLCGWSRKSSGRSLLRALEQLAPAKILGITLLDV